MIGFLDVVDSWPRTPRLWHATMLISFWLMVLDTVAILDVWGWGAVGNVAALTLLTFTFVESFGDC